MVPGVALGRGAWSKCWLVDLQFPCSFCRGKLPEGFSEVFTLLFAQYSVNLSDESARKSRSKYLENSIQSPLRIINCIVHLQCPFLGEDTRLKWQCETIEQKHRTSYLYIRSCLRLLCIDCASLDGFSSYDMISRHLGFFIRATPLQACRDDMLTYVARVPIRTKTIYPAAGI